MHSALRTMFIYTNDALFNISCAKHIALLNYIKNDYVLKCVNTATMEELLAQRDLDIQQAARYGQQLLEENRELTCELEKQRLQTISAQQQLESQQQHHLKKCVDLQRTSTSQMEEMEAEIVDLLDRLDRSNKEASTERVRHEIAEKKLKGEIASVEEELRNEKSRRERVNQEKEDYESRLTNSQQEYDRLREITKSLRMQVKQQASENRTLRDHVSHCSQLNEQLSEELRDTRESFEYSEKLRLKAEAQIKQLTDKMNEEREIYEQQSLNQSQSVHNGQTSQSTASRSTMSLMEEMNLLGLEQSADSVFMDNNELMFHRQLMISPDQDTCTLEQLVHSELQTSSPVAAAGWTQCTRCSELQDQVKRSQYEMEQINLQLMDAVKHKFRLQLEVEKWESDMEAMVQREVARISAAGATSNRTTPKRRRSSIFQIMPAPKPRTKLLTQ